jgi:hypothetical protein
MSDAKHLIGLFCTSSQSGFIYKLASESYYELLNFAVDGLILLLYVKIAFCLRWLQFARAISRSILQYCVTILQSCSANSLLFKKLLLLKFLRLKFLRSKQRRSTLRKCTRNGTPDLTVFV